MKFVSESQALERLRRLKDDFAARIAEDFEHNAKSCVTCGTPGACCLDVHFVNVRISRLEAVAIAKTIQALSPERQEKVRRRIDESIERYGLAEPDDAAAKTYACPLFEKGIGCLVHSTAKPLPCIQHACYENEKDLPPDDLLAEQEGLVDELNRRVYGNVGTLASLPVGVNLAAKSAQSPAALYDNCDHDAGDEPAA
ncbi:MAG: hypothetical protein ABI791_02380 [Acidobacteriota bacterium]